MSFGFWQTEARKVVVICVNVSSFPGITAILRDGAARLYQVPRGRQCILNTTSLWTCLDAET